MILENVFLKSRANAYYETTGIDSYINCEDKEHFNSYPYSLDYKFNSRGFRDEEWPTSFNDEIWCFGDSFTVGLGTPYHMIWPKKLQSDLDRRCINVSMDGASNYWIFRKVCDVITVINPKVIIIHWTYLHRWERPQEQLLDEDRRAWEREPYPDVELQIKEFRYLIDCLSTYKNIKIIHSFVPNWDVLLKNTLELSELKYELVKGSDWPNKIYDVKNNIPSNNVLQEINQYHELRNGLYVLNYSGNLIPEIENNLGSVAQIDFSRDGFHYGELTVNNYVSRLLEFL